MDLFNYSRRETSVSCGNVEVGSNPVRVQSMTNTATRNTETCVEQAKELLMRGRLCGLPRKESRPKTSGTSTLNSENKGTQTAGGRWIARLRWPMLAALACRRSAH